MFSIIIPVYNVAPYIRKCLDSVLAQDFDDWEVLLIDDGSTDGSGSVCDEYAGRDSRFRVFHKTNGGVSSARNVGLDHVCGEWIWFVDGDDYIMPGAMSVLHNAIKTYRCDTIFFGAFDDWGGTVSSPDSRRTAIVDVPKNEFLCSVCSYVNPAMLFSRKYFVENNIRFTVGIKMAEDLEVQYKYLIYAESPIQIPDNLYVYRHRAGSAMANPDTEINNMYDCLRVCNNLLDTVKSIDYPPVEWLTHRVRQLLKGCIQSAERVPKAKIGDLQIQLRRVVDGYCSVGYKHIADKTLNLALVNLNLYFICLNLYYILKGKR